MAAEVGEKGAVEVEQGAAAAAKEVIGGDTITLESSDGKPFKLSKEVEAQLKKFLDKNKKKISGGCIQLGKIGSETLEKVVDYCNRHANDSDPIAAAAAGGTSGFDTAASVDLKEWDRKLVDGLSMEAFFDLIEAADGLQVDGLLDLTCRKLASMMKGKTPVQIREVFNIKNDYTPEQEQKIRKEHAWAFLDY